MAVEQPRFVTCPNCHQTLPQTAIRCQFCGHPLPHVQPVTVPGVKVLRKDQTRKYNLTWQEWGYIVCSSLIVLNGVYDLLIGFAFIPTAAVSKYGGGAYYGIAGTIEAGMGAALLAQQLWAQFIMKWVCVLGIFAELRSMVLASALSSVFVVPALGYIFSIAKITVMGFTIYFIVDLADV